MSKVQDKDNFKIWIFLKGSFEIQIDGLKSEGNEVMPLLRIYSEGSAKNRFFEGYPYFGVPVVVGAKYLTIFNIFPNFAIHGDSHFYLFDPLVLVSASLDDNGGPKLGSGTVDLYPLSQYGLLSTPGVSHEGGRVQLIVRIAGVAIAGISDE